MFRERLQPNEKNLSDMSRQEFSLHSRLHYRRDNHDFVTFLIKDLDVPYSARILEIGCRAGWLSLEIARRLPEAMVVAVDSDGEMIQIAEINRSIEKVENVEFSIQNPNDLTQLESSSFDVVVSSRILHLLNQPIYFFNEVKRILSAQGKYAITDVRRDLTLIAKAAIWFAGRGMAPEFREYWKNDFYSAYSFQEVVKILIGTNLKDWKVQTSLFDFLIHN
ncbi:MAG: methyltransferase domain-containing protein [bacterium]|nr:methyltransferase domain-containing protein [bacterium]